MKYGHHGNKDISDILSDITPDENLYFDLHLGSK